MINRTKHFNTNKVGNFENTALILNHLQNDHSAVYPNPYTDSKFQVHRAESFSISASAPFVAAFVLHVQKPPIPVGRL